jgi:hypothetical protein
MIAKKKALLVAAFGLSLTAPQAHATLFDLSYTLADGSNLTAVLDGTVQSDFNTVVVNSVLDFAALDGTSGPALPFLYGYDYFLGQPTSPLPTLTLDGSFMDLLACADAACNDGFGFAVGDVYASTIGDNIYSAGASFGNTFELYNAASNTLHPPAPTSIPTLSEWGMTLLSSLLAIGGAALQRRGASKRLRGLASNSNAELSAPSGVARHL